MAEPPTDEHGLVIPHDDPEIRDDDIVIRYIHPVHGIVVDTNRGDKRLSSAAFSASSVPRYGMSVDLERRLHEAGLDSLARLPDQSYGAVRIIVGDLRKLGLMVGSSPTAENPFHAEIWQVKKKAKSRIRDLAQWLKKPAGFG